MIFRILIIIMIVGATLCARTEIWLSSTNFEQSRLPDRILISVFSDKSGLYLLDGFGGPVASGKLKAGHTIIPVKMALKAGIKRYRFKLRYSDKKERMWSLVLRIVAGAHEKSRKIQGDVCYVRLYRKGKLVADRNKYRIRKLTTKTAGEPEEINYGKYDPVTGDYPGLRRLSLPVLALPLMLIKMAAEKKIKQAREKKKRRMRVISGTFRNNYGKDVKLAVMLGVKEEK